MRRFFDPSSPLLNPADLICAFTGKKPDELTLPRRAIITVNDNDVRALEKRLIAKPVKAWAPFRRIYRIEGKETIVTRSWYGGPNIAALVEELSAFGVREFCLWGYMGGINPDLVVGDIVVATGALRDEGTSHHYLDDREEVIHSAWANEWSLRPGCAQFRAGAVWSCDAIYRETREKLEEYRRAGLLGVEMEVASFYAVCQAKELCGAAFLAVSDVFRKDGTWVPGFCHDGIL